MKLQCTAITKQVAFAALLMLVSAVCILFVTWNGSIREGRYQITRPVDPLPKLSEIDLLTAMVFDEAPTFAVHPSRWNSIRSGMLPAEIDKHPTTWEVLGRLNIVTKNGQALRVDLYYVDEIGAFSIDGKYYRGGNSKTLRSSILSASEDQRR